MPFLLRKTALVYKMFIKSYVNVYEMLIPMSFLLCILHFRVKKFDLDEAGQHVDEISVSVVH